MRFDYSDFQTNGIFFPRYFHSLFSIDRKTYSKLEEEYDDFGKDLPFALSEIKKRTTDDYFSKILMAQTGAMNYAEYVFPTYKFIVSDALWDDWLATIDPHKSYCRDHSLHQPLTAYIACKLLGYGDAVQSLLLPNKERLLSYCARQMLESPQMKYLRDYFTELYPNYTRIPKLLYQSFAEDVFYETAIISSIFHDIGYPWQYINRLSSSLRIADPKFASTIGRSLDDILDAVCDRLLAFPFYGYSTVCKARPVSTWKNTLKMLLDRAFRTTHGFPGALGFTFLNDVVRIFPSDLNFNDAVFRFILDWGAVGIMMHDMPRIYKGDKNHSGVPTLRLSFERDPLSSLISLCDILEEFQRPQARFVKSSGALKIDYPDACDYSDLTISGGKITITYRFKDLNTAIKMKSIRKEEVADYLNLMNGYIDLSQLGVKSVECRVIS
jgi:hypothetical protein